MYNKFLNYKNSLKLKFFYYFSFIFLKKYYLSRSGPNAIQTNQLGLIFLSPNYSAELGQVKFDSLGGFTVLYKHRRRDETKKKKTKEILQA